MLKPIQTCILLAGLCALTPSTAKAGTKIISLDPQISNYDNKIVFNFAYRTKKDPNTTKLQNLKYGLNTISYDGDLVYMLIDNNRGAPSLEASTSSNSDPLRHTCFAIVSCGDCDQLETIVVGQ
jgi:hypothetical protein